ncbi:MAG: 3-dehydroquinate synthase [Myxococcota bacterium]
MQDGTLWLVGMMGAGKSAVGEALAAALGWPFVDLDAEIERAAGQSTREIFASEGESGFRGRESEALEAVAGRRAVVALGGGAPAQPGVPERLAATGRAIYLRARPETLVARVGEGTERPLLAGLSAPEREAELGRLLAEREGAYLRATWTIDTDGLAVADVVRQLVDRLDGNGASARRVEVALGERSYAIEIGAGTLPGLGAAVKRVVEPTRVFVITTPPVGRRYAGRVMRSLRDAGLRARRFDVPDGERSKNLTQAGRLYDALLGAGADRGSAVVALGGGVVGDLAGFVAATLLRGIPIVQVPTSLLAMVDSSVGGKTGVNVKRGKNLVGAFHQPRLVWIDAETLETLPPRQLRAGLAEVVKHAAIRDAALFALLEAEADALGSVADPERWVPILARNCAIKAAVVAEDEREAGLRMLLNFGHTLGHAVEALARYRGVLHGEAVAMGMAFAARHSERLGLAEAGTADRLVALLERLGLPTALPPHPRRAYLGALAVDKKKRDARIHFVALRAIGRAETVPLLPREILPPEAL